MIPQGLDKMLAARRKFVDDNSEVSVAAGGGKGGTYGADVRVVGSKFAGMNFNPREPSGFTGLVNQGATCYLNSLCQSWFMVPSFRRAVFQWEYDAELHGEAEMCLPLQLQRLFVQLQLSEQAAVSTRALTRSFGWLGSEAFVQHDVQECMSVVMENLATACAGAPLGDYLAEHHAGIFFNMLRCHNCMQARGHEELFRELSVNVGGVGSLENAIREFITPEILDGVNCGNCDAAHAHSKGMLLRRLPTVMPIQLKRFTLDFNTMQRVKLTDPFTFPTELDMRPYMEHDHGDDSNDGDDTNGNGAEAVDPIMYDLVSVFLHTGGGYAGHYFAYVRDLSEPTRWYNFNDASVQELDEESVMVALGQQEEAETESEEQDKDKDADKDKENSDGQRNHGADNLPTPPTPAEGQPSGPPKGPALPPPLPSAGAMAAAAAVAARAAVAAGSCGAGSVTASANASAGGDASDGKARALAKATTNAYMLFYVRRPNAMDGAMAPVTDADVPESLKTWIQGDNERFLDLKTEWQKEHSYLHLKLIHEGNMHMIRINQSETVQDLTQLCVNQIVAESGDDNALPEIDRIRLRSFDNIKGILLGPLGERDRVLETIPDTVLRRPLQMEIANEHGEFEDIVEDGVPVRISVYLPPDTNAGEGDVLTSTADIGADANAGTEAIAGNSAAGSSAPPTAPPLPPPLPGAGTPGTNGAAGAGSTAKRRDQPFHDPVTVNLPLEGTMRNALRMVWNKTRHLVANPDKVRPQDEGTSAACMFVMRMQQDDPEMILTPYSHSFSLDRTVQQMNITAGDQLFIEVPDDDSIPEHLDDALIAAAVSQQESQEGDGGSGDLGDEEVMAQVHLAAASSLSKAMQYFEHMCNEITVYFNPLAETAGEWVMIEGGEAAPAVVSAGERKEGGAEELEGSGPSAGTASDSGSSGSSSEAKQADDSTTTEAAEAAGDSAASEPEKLHLTLDQRTSIGELRHRMAEMLGVSERSFKIQGNGAVEIKDTDQTLAFAGIGDGDALQVQWGTPLAPGEYDAQILLLRDGDEPPMALGTLPVSRKKEVQTLKQEVVERFTDTIGSIVPKLLKAKLDTQERTCAPAAEGGEGGEDGSGLPRRRRLHAAAIRLRECTATPSGLYKPAAVLRDDCKCVGDVVNVMRDGLPIGMQLLDAPETFTKAHLLMRLQRWFPQRSELGPVEEISLQSGMKFGDLRQMLADRIAADMAAGVSAAADPKPEEEKDAEAGPDASEASNGADMVSVEAGAAEDDGNDTPPVPSTPPEPRDIRALKPWAWQVKDVSNLPLLRWHVQSGVASLITEGNLRLQHGDLVVYKDARERELVEIPPEEESAAEDAHGGGEVGFRIYSAAEQRHMRDEKEQEEKERQELLEEQMAAVAEKVGVNVVAQDGPAGEETPKDKGEGDAPPNSEDC